MSGSDTITVEVALRLSIARLMGASGSPRLDAQLILSHVLDVPREALLAHPERALSNLDAKTFDKLITLRTRGMPVAYLLGQRPFYDRTFRVSPHVLIPRPETEKLVELALTWARQQPDAARLRIIDVGTGSGVIGLTLAAHLPGAHVVAADVSHLALDVARENAGQLANVDFVQADLLAPFRGNFDLIASNLPYIASAEMNILDVAKFEPTVALDGGADGLTLIGRLLQAAPRLLNRPGLLLLEHGADQGAAVSALAVAAFPDDQVTLIQDDSGLDRLVRIECVQPLNSP